MLLKYEVFLSLNIQFQVLKIIKNNHVLMNQYLEW